MIILVVNGRPVGSFKMHLDFGGCHILGFGFCSRKFGTLKTRFVVSLHVRVHARNPDVRFLLVIGGDL